MTESPLRKPNNKPRIAWTKSFMVDTKCKPTFRNVFQHFLLIDFFFHTSHIYRERAFWHHSWISHTFPIVLVCLWSLSGFCSQFPITILSVIFIKRPLQQKCAPKPEKCEIWIPFWTETRQNTFPWGFDEVQWWVIFFCLAFVGNKRYPVIFGFPVISHTVENAYWWVHVCRGCSATTARKIANFTWKWAQEQGASIHVWWCMCKNLCDVKRPRKPCAISLKNICRPEFWSERLDSFFNGCATTFRTDIGREPVHKIYLRFLFPKRWDFYFQMDFWAGSRGATALSIPDSESACKSTSRTVAWWRLPGPWKKSVEIPDPGISSDFTTILFPPLWKE